MRTQRKLSKRPIFSSPPAELRTLKVLGSIRSACQSQRTENGQVLISVSDTGVSLPPEKAERIFEAVFTTRPHGTGMGLRISRSIVESHGGRLWAANNSPCGAHFAFTLSTKIEGSE